MDASGRSDYTAKFLILSGLRRLEPIVDEEIERMPILTDIMDHQIIGPAIRKGLAEGLKQGRELGVELGREQGLELGRRRGLELGIAEGEAKGRSEVIRRQLQKRFGSVPDWVETCLTNFSSPQLDDLAVRILDATSLEDLFPR